MRFTTLEDQNTVKSVAGISFKHIYPIMIDSRHIYRVTAVQSNTHALSTVRQTNNVKTGKVEDLKRSKLQGAISESRRTGTWWC